MKQKLIVFIFTLFLMSSTDTITAYAETSPNVLQQMEEIISLRSLKTVPIPEPNGLDEIVRDRTAAVQLGKALFWDMQVGSDSIQACASCHFHAGADNRTRNALSPGLLDQRYNGIPGDPVYQTGDSNFGDSTIEGIDGFPNFGPDYILLPEDFPLHLRVHPADQQESRISRNTNDVVSSQGVMLNLFIDIKLGSSVEEWVQIFDSVFNLDNVTKDETQATALGDDIIIPLHTYEKNLRRVEPRNSPTVINSVFNFANFWDGRANNIFNGLNPFGPLDQDAQIFVNGQDGTMELMTLRLENASLASQAVGPPVSDFEMSYHGRTLSKLGKKMLALRPLAQQQVHPNDSVLGSLKGGYGQGLDTTYTAMIRQAFHPKFWDSNDIVYFVPHTAEMSESPLQSNKYIAIDNGIYYIEEPHCQDPNHEHFSHMESNFALFFGIALQMYQATLVSDETPFDRYAGLQGPEIDGDPDALTAQQKRGLEIFMGEGRCINCHGGPEFTNASVQNAQNGNNLVESMLMADEDEAFYDNGFYNVAVRKTPEDISRGGLSPFINPLTGELYPLSYSRLAMLKRDNLLPENVARHVPDLPEPNSLNRVAVDGSHKTPGLRNVELTGPYFSNGSAATLMQVVNFYVRGGNFPHDNIDNLDPDIRELHRLQGNQEDKEALVAFMLGLTDERVKYEKAPFDHPELKIPINADTPDLWHWKPYMFDTIPAVGAEGRTVEGLPPLTSFLGMNPMTPDPIVYINVDFTGNGIVNLEDFSVLAGDWMRMGNYETDLTGPFGMPDRNVDLYDLRAFFSQWLHESE